MANRILYAGGRLDSLEELVAGGVEDTGTGGRDTAYTDASVRFPTQTGAALRGRFRDASFALTSVGVGSSVYAHCETYTSGNTLGSCNLFELRDLSGNPWVAIRTPNSNGAVFGLYYNSGTVAVPVWTLLGAQVGIVQNTLTTYDIRVILGEGGDHTAELYRNRALVASGTFTQALMTNLAAVDIRNYVQTTIRYTYFSQVLCTEGISTIGAKVKYTRPTAAGASSEWAGAVTDVNEGANSDVTVNTATTAGLTQTYAMGDITVPVGYVIKAVWQWLRAKNDGVSPLNIKAVLRSGGSAYVSGNVSGMAIGMSPVGMCYDTDPATGLPWTQDGWNAAEAGYQSAA